MKIIGYTHLHRITNPTGVGKHIINMLGRISALPDVDLKLLTFQEQLKARSSLPSDHPVASLPIIVHPGKRSRAEWSWNLLHAPSIDSRLPDGDWIYSPSEQYIPSKKMRLAVTVHCVNWCETNLPWSYDKGMRSARLRWNLAMRPILKRADIIFVVSDFLKGRIVELFNANPEKLVVLGNGVENEYFEIARRPRQTPAVPYLLVIGGLTRRKSGQSILNVAKLIQDRKENMEIWIAGDGEAQFDDDARMLKSIRLLGYQNLQQLPDLIRNATALLFPSRYETFGIPAVEAMAAGTPPIVSHFGALPEVVGEGGVVVDPADAAQVLDAACRFRDDPHYRETVAAKGVSRALHFTWDRLAQEAVKKMRDVS